MFRTRFASSGLGTTAATSLFVIILAALLCLAGCGGGGGNGGGSNPISVSVTASSTTVDSHDSVTVTAAVSNDSSNAGVTWTVPALGTLSNSTAASPTYTAPAATSSAQTVTLTATSVTDKSKSNSVTLTIPAAPTITTSSLPSFVAGAAYSTTLAGSGGIAPYTWKLIGGAWPTGLSLNATTGVISAAAGTTTTTSATPLTFQLTDSGTPTALTATATLNLTINPQPSEPVAGSVIYNDSSICGSFSSTAGPATTVSINTNPVQTTTTDSKGRFSFPAIPQGSYTITPSLAGTNALFTPATQNITVGSGGAVASFKGVVGYSVSGTVSYSSGSATGPINLALRGGCTVGSVSYGSGSYLGTTITAPGSFTINGVPPGTYNILAWRDAAHDNAPNASDPTVISTAFTVFDANATGVSVPLADPAAVSFPSTPPFVGAIPIDQGVVLSANYISEDFSHTSAFWQSQGRSLPEVATSYTVQWSTDQNFINNVQSKSFPATGGTEYTWVLNGLTNGQKLYFRDRGVLGSTTSPWSPVWGPTTVGEPTGTVTVSGIVTFPSAATGSLYISFQDLATRKTYYTSVASPTSPQNYSIQLPAAGNYAAWAYIDQNHDNILNDNGDMISLNSVYNLAVTGNSATKDFKLEGGGNSAIDVELSKYQYVNMYGSTRQSAHLLAIAWSGSKQLGAMQLVSGPNAIVPQDFNRCNWGSDISFCAGFELDGNPPKVGDTYDFRFTYSDGSSENVSYAIASVPGDFGANPTPSGMGTDLTPTFSWTDPPNASDYKYSFQLYNPGSGNWNIPASGWGSFSSSIDSVTFGVDPTGGSDLPSFSSLTSGAQDQWFVSAVDSSNNSSSLTVGYYPGYTRVALPDANPSTLGAAKVGQSYTGTIVATNGVLPDTFAVVGLCDGLTYSSNGGTLTISGTPLAAGTVSFQVFVIDNSNAYWGPVTYTINVGN